MLYLLLANLIAGLAAPLMVRWSRTAAPWILGTVPLVSAAALVASYFSHPGTVVSVAWDWVPQLGAAFAL